MADYFSEWIVKRKTPQKAKVIQVLLILLCVVGVILLLIPYAGILLEALLIFLTYVYYKNNNVEWEYSLVEKTLYVDKIMNKSKRKRMAEYDMTKVEVVAPEDSYRIKEYDKRNLRVVDFSSLIPDRDRFVMVIMNNNELIKAVIEPNERMLKELRDVAPRQVHMD